MRPKRATAASVIFCTAESSAMSARYASAWPPRSSISRATASTSARRRRRRRAQARWRARYCARRRSPARRGLQARWGETWSGPGEHRLALFHEGLAALGIVVAGVAALDQFRAAREVAHRLVLDRLTDDVFGRMHRERRVG